MAAVRVDGSSTVYPLTEAMAEGFRSVDPAVRVMVGVSGTGGGFKKLINNEIDLSGASRPVKKEEQEQLKAKGVGILELPVAYDGLTVVVNPKNTFVDHLTVAELQHIWRAEKPARMWSDVRATWPKEKIVLFGPGTDSGTFDYFTEVINGKSKSCRPDFTASEDDNVLVSGVEGSPYALGYFGFAYYKENQSKLKAVPVDGGKGSIAPSEITIQNGTYQPLSRPVFVYVNANALSRPEVNKFVSFYISKSSETSVQTGFIPFEKDVYDAIMERFLQKNMGTSFGTPGAKGVRDIKKLVALKGE